MEPTPRPDARFVLGIDPGTTTGLAAFCPSVRRLAFVDSAGPLATLRLITAWHREGRLAAAVIEDSRGLPIYARHGRANKGQRDRIARNVGRVDCLTDLYVSLLDSLGVPVTSAEPARAKKWDADTLRRVTGWTDRTNEHGRDAARLVLGCTARAVSPMHGGQSHARQSARGARGKAGGPHPVAQPRHDGEAAGA